MYSIYTSILYKRNLINKDRNYIFCGEFRIGKRETEELTMYPPIVDLTFS